MQGRALARRVDVSDAAQMQALADEVRQQFGAPHFVFNNAGVGAGSMMESGAHALGCTVFAGSTGQTEQQVQAMADLRPAGYVGTPSSTTSAMAYDSMGSGRPALAI